MPMASTTNTRLAVEPLSPTIGAEIGDIDLTQPVSPAQAIELRALLVKWKVIFFRDQHITTEQHLAFGRVFGDLEVHPFSDCKPGYPEVLDITHDQNSRGRENVWHSDVTWRIEPSLGSILRARQVPVVGGDTLFCDMAAAYDGLDAAVKEQVEGRFTRNTMGFYEKLMRKRGATEEEIAESYRQFPPVEHPLVRTHPESGRKCLYMNPGFVRHVVGMEPQESADLLAHLYAQSRIPEYQCRFRWRADSIAFWDNRSAQHYAVSDYFPAVRRMERVTVVGDRPYLQAADGSRTYSRIADTQVPA